MYTFNSALKYWFQTGFLFVLATIYAAIVVAAPVAPDLSNTQIYSQATFSAVQNIYTYKYRVVNPNTNNEVISAFRVDITTEGRQNTTMSNPLPQYPAFKSSTLKYLSQKGMRILPVEMFPPTDWAALNISAKGTASFMAVGREAPIDTDMESGDDAVIAPGEQVDGFLITSIYVPGIRKVHVAPGGIDRWFSLFNAKDESEEALKKAKEIRESFNYHSYALGPVGVSEGTYAHWNQLRDDLRQAIDLGWIADNTLADILKGQLAAAREALDASDGTLAKARLQTLVEQADNAAATQIRTEARDLVVLNAQSLITNTADTPIPFGPKLTVVPVTDELPIGVRHTVTAKVVNVAHNDEPVSGVSLEFLVQDGPHAGLRKIVWTDSNGEASFSYMGEGLGTDRILVRHPEPQS
jgi:hypothetical protein